MPDLPARILSALDDALAQEIGARLRQAALNSPPASGGATALPPRFEEGLLRLKAMHAQAKVLVRKTFEAAENGALAKSGTLSSLQKPVLKTIGDELPERGARSPKTIRRNSKKRTTKQEY
jgi:hypothetical protein